MTIKVSEAWCDKCSCYLLPEYTQEKDSYDTVTCENCGDISIFTYPDKNEDMNDKRLNKIKSGVRI